MSNVKTQSLLYYCEIKNIKNIEESMTTFAFSCTLCEHATERIDPSTVQSIQKEKNAAWASKITIRLGTIFSIFSGVITIRRPRRSREFSHYSISGRQKWYTDVSRIFLLLLHNLSLTVDSSGLFAMLVWFGLCCFACDGVWLGYQAGQAIADGVPVPAIINNTLHILTLKGTRLWP